MEQKSGSSIYKLKSQGSIINGNNGGLGGRRREVRWEREP
jgi:hypothetical protein